MEAEASSIERLRSLDAQVHVWLARPDEIADPESQAACRAQLSAEECRRLDRLRREADRLTFLAAHALVRRALSRYTAVPPHAWVFGANRRGRPEIAGPATAPALHFSLSHTAGLCACAVARDGACGVDVESLDRGGHPLTVARRVLTADELADLEARPEGERRARFLTYWTLKEAYVKARGVGLAASLRGISFSLVGERVRLTAGPPDGAADGRWQFATLRPTPRHVLGIALRPGADGPPRAIVVREGLLAGA